ncbi:MAG TPA: 50S ribosomal protein L18 [Bdellovibrionota bacterium]|nr:50S ribosomal protein L18 [Bdellovibrionota bacterium]
MHSRQEGRVIRKARVRKRLTVSSQRPRLSVFRSNRHLYAQIIDDGAHKTVVAASTMSKELKGEIKKTTTIEAAQKVGQLIARKAIEKNVKEVAFDRGAYLYHGRVKALADAARAGGLKF